MPCAFTNQEKDAFTQVKRTATERCPFGEGILLLMGVAKNYIMYWGGYKLIIANPHKKCSQTIFYFSDSFVQKNDTFSFPSKKIMSK